MNIVIRFLKSWWIILLCVIVGGLLGFLGSRFQKPLYEARAVISSSIDFSQTDELTDIEEDIAFETIGDIISSDIVWQATADEMGPGFDYPQLRTMSGLERMQTNWILVVRSEQADEAAKICNVWADQSMAVLLEAQIHAEEVSTLFAEIEGLKSCTEPLDEESQSAPVCNDFTIDELTQKINDLSELMETEKTLALNLMAAQSVFLESKAVIPVSPIQFQMSTFVLGGGIAGLVLGLWLVLLKK